MAALMVLDHLHYFLPSQPDWFHWLGRIVAPTFCYLMTESLRHTRDRGTFLRRMLGAGLLMFAGSIALQLALGGPVIANSIFLSLAVSGYLVDGLEKRREGASRIYLLLPLLALALTIVPVRGHIIFHIEGGVFIPLITVIFYFLHDRKPIMCLCYVLAAGAVVYLIEGGVTVQQLQAFAVVPILLYNGKRGPGGRFSKWFFYLFYPLHIWILYAVRYWPSL